MWSASTTSGANRYAPETQEKLLRLLFAALKKLDALVLSDYDKGLITDDLADRVLSAAHQLKVPVFVESRRGNSMRTGDRVWSPATRRKRVSW